MSVHEINELMDRAEELPQGSSRIALLSQAQKLAAAHKEESLEYQARYMLIEASTEASQYENVLLHFPWLLAYADRPDTVANTGKLLYLYEWAVVSLHYFHSVSKAKILELTADLVERVNRANYPAFRGIKINRVTFMQLGMWEEAAKMQELYEIEAAKGAVTRFGIGMVMSDRYVNAFYHEKIGQPKVAYEILKPLFASPEETPTDLNVYARALLINQVLKWGYHEEAIEFYHFLMATMDISSGYMACLNDVIDFLVTTANFDKAFSLFESMLEINETNKVHASRMAYCFTAENFCSKLGEARGDQLKIRLPRFHPLYNSEGKYSAAALAEHYKNEGMSLLNKFNERNGNSWKTMYMKQEGWYRSELIPLSLSTSAGSPE